MHRVTRNHAFTLIELLTVIAIIAVLAAILFPVAGSVKEQARQSSCMTNLHQIWVATMMYHQDEGSYPPLLLQTIQYELGPNNQTLVVPADQVANGFLYREYVKDISAFKCDDNPITDKTLGVNAIAPVVPSQWPGGAANWNTAMSGVFYGWDSYDIGPRINPNGTVAKDNNGNVLYDIHYSMDWTGPANSGATDLPNQMKYAYPPEDHTLLTYCTWHVATAGSNSVIAINLGGTAKKFSYKEMLEYGPNVFNQ